MSIRVPALLLLVAALAATADLTAQTGGQAAIGEPAPGFTLVDTNGGSHTLSDYRGEWVVLEWLNYDCPYVKKHYGGGNMQALQEKYGAKGVKWLAIVSSDVGTQGYFEPAAMNARSAREGSKAAAVLYDTDGAVGHAYDARTTPQMLVIDPEGVLLYNGAIDDKPTSRLSDLEGAHNYLAAALDQAMAGEPVATPVTQPYGCSVKYRK